MVTAGDVVLALSNSGEVGEVTAILPVIKRLGVPLIAMTGGLQSTLARHADIVLDCGVGEACPHNLAPTTSTTAQIAMGDALAVALLPGRARGFRPEDCPLAPRRCAGPQAAHPCERRDALGHRSAACGA